MGILTYDPNLQGHGKVDIFYVSGLAHFNVGWHDGTQACATGAPGQLVYNIFITRCRGAPVAPPSRPRPSPCPVRLAPSPPRPVPPPSDARATTNIKEMPLDRRETVISKRCCRDRAGPRITDDSNSQNVNVGYFQLKALVSQSVSQSQITVIIMLII